ncbi:MAG: recombination mediator RecR [Bacteroidales bacterium]
MNIQTYPSKLLGSAVEEFSKLPGIGRRSALRLVLHLLRQEPGEVDRLTEALGNLRHNVKFCKVCHNISDTDTCSICASPNRDSSTICVVETIKDVMMIENTPQFNGLYHVLGGVISPMEGIGPTDLNIDNLVSRVSKESIREVIMALSATMEGDTTNFYIFKKLNQLSVSVSTLARGVAFGDELEYTDEITLGRALVNRVKFETTLSE